MEALAGNMNIEDITTDDDNRLILYRIRSNKEDTQDLYIQNEHEIEINEEEGTFEHILPDYVPEGVYDMGWLGYFIGRNTCLQNLYIRDFEPTSGESVMEVFESFFRGVNNNKSITTLDFQHMDTFGGRVFTLLEPFFKNNHNLITFNVDECNLGEEGARLLALAIGSSKHQSLHKVKLFNCNIADEGLVYIITALSMHPNMRGLDLDGNQLNKIGCMALTTLLQNSATKLQVLDISRNNIDDEGIETLVSVLSKCTELKELYIDNSPSITIRGWKILASTLKAPASNLEILSINRNNVDDQVLTFMVDSLANNNTLVGLFFLDGNQVTAKGWEALSKLLCDTSSVNSTYLSNHTLYDIDIRGPERSNQNMSQDLINDFGPVLQLNGAEDKKQVAIMKIYNPNLDMTPFFEWEFKILPLMINWLERAFVTLMTFFDEEPTSLESESIMKGRAIDDPDKLSCIYQFVRGMPLLCVENQLRKQLDDINAELTFMLCPSCSILPQMEEDSPGQRKRQDRKSVV